jgi:hypothetical protein
MPMADGQEDDGFVEREADAAAREAGAIGGRRPDDEPDDAEHPVSEGGGGEAEGFEQAEEALRSHAEHEDPGGDPLADRPPPEDEGDAATYGEADHVRSSETETPD